MVARLALILVFWLALANASSASGDRPGDFDFYVLSLSWSPSYCAAEGENANPQQCAEPGRYGFIVHGLWPQYESGYPEFCPARGGDRVPRALGEQYFDIMPGMGLIGHQWRKHGSCSGLSQVDYFAVLRKARERINLPSSLTASSAAPLIDPDTVETLFLQANPGLSPEGIAVTCDRRRIRDVRLCLTRDLAFRPCREVDGAACRLDRAAMPPVD